MPDESVIEATQNRVVELFGAVCADPDDRAVADAADEALRELDKLLTT